jgi:hypothetical protein
MEQTERRKRQDIINLSLSPTAIDSVKCKQMNCAAILRAEVKYLIKDISGGDKYVFCVRICIPVLVENSC